VSRAVVGLDPEALDFRAASESFARVRTLGRTDLETLRLVMVRPGRKVPTVGEMLLFGRDRERHFPDARIQAGPFQSTEKAIDLTPRATRTGPQDPKRRYFRAE
jgi:ATP-dependent DNA helicase RecG